MLPNWLLGKSKSKLQEILGGGGGGGTDYTAGDGIDISNGVISFDPATTPAIDPSKIDGLDDDLAALAPKTELSNPNILHNPWFTVNQREVTSVTTGGSYPADRWRTAGAGTLNITRDSNGCLVINNSESESDAYIVQRRTETYVNSLRGNKLTGSIMLSDGTIHSGTITSPYESNVYYEDDDMKLYTNFNTSSVESFVLQVKAGASITVKALKLEVGEISTLHLDPRPEYAIELAKCQRYFQRLVNNTDSAKAICTAASASSTAISYNLFLPSEMRATPTLNSSGLALSDLTGETVTTTIRLSGPVLLNNNLRFIATSSASITQGDHYNLKLQAGGYIDLSAEL